MAMIHCPECDRTVSTEAVTCPNCGYSLRSTGFDSPSTSQAICAVSSFFFPGLGQLIQGRMGAAIGYFLASIALWIITLGFFGWVVHVIAAWDAARYRPTYF